LDLLKVSRWLEKAISHKVMILPNNYKQTKNDPIALAEEALEKSNNISFNNLSCFFVSSTVFICAVCLSCILNYEISFFNF